MTVVTVSLRVMVVLIIIRFGQWELPSECMQFSIAVSYSDSDSESDSDTITDTVKDASEMGLDGKMGRDETGQEMASILSIGITAFFDIFSGTLTS